MQQSHRVPILAASRRHADSGGTVVAPHEQSVRAGLDLLERGGNAVDAAVAAALVAGVIEPTETTLAGSGFMLVWEPDEGPWSVDFGPTAPLAATPDMFELDTVAASSNVLGLAPVVAAANVDGPLASGVPRTLLGLLDGHKRLGNLDRAQVCAAAVAIAREGFLADSWFLVNTLSDLDRLSRNETTAETFLSGGLPIGSASAASYGLSIDTPPRVRQERLATLLEQVVAEGTEAIISGSIARALLETAREQGMLLSAADLAGASPRIERPLSLDYRGHQVWVPRAPSGGITELQILAIWQVLYPHRETSPTTESTRALALAMKHAFADRYHWLGDPDVVRVPFEEILSDTYARHIADLCRNETPPESFRDGSTPWLTFASRALHDPWAVSSQSGPVWNPATVNSPTAGTTHVSAADPEGRVVSITHTAANHFGSGVMCPRTGLLFDSAMAWFNAAPGAANSIRGGARPVANMGPALLSSEGQAVAALGASGGRRIVSAVAQLIIGLVDRRQSALETLQSPRFDASGPAIVMHENLASSVGELPDLAVQVVPEGNTPYTLDFARANIARVLGDGGTESAIDSRAYGY